MRLLSDCFVGKGLKRGVPGGAEKILAATAFLLIAIAMMGNGGANAAAFPDTATCITTPTINFPAVATVDSEYLLTTTCPTPDMNEGDFVTITIRNLGGFSVKSLSDYVETDTGIEWIAPLSDSNGTAWYSLVLNHETFDCNEAGAIYQVNVNWDGQTKAKNFTVVCPTITFSKYQISVSFWDSLVIELLLEDNRGYRMQNVKCDAEIVRGLNGDYNAIKIIKSFPTIETDSSGHAEFEIDTGLLSGVMEGYEYEFMVHCLGADENFSFTITEPDSQRLNNPIYNFMGFLGNNFLAIFVIIIIGIVCLAVFGLGIRKVLGG